MSRRPIRCAPIAAEWAEGRSIRTRHQRLAVIANYLDWMRRNETGAVRTLGMVVS